MSRPARTELMIYSQRNAPDGRICAMRKLRLRMPASVTEHPVPAPAAEGRPSRCHRVVHAQGGTPPGQRRDTELVNHQWTHVGRLWTNGDPFLAVDATLRDAWLGFS